MDRTNFQFAYSHIEALDAANSVEALLDVLSRAATYYGFSSFAVTALRTFNTDWKNQQYIVSMPKGWLEHYVERNFQNVDPVVRRVLTTTEPFAWHEAGAQNQLSKSEATVMSHATEFGLRAGFIVPVHMASGDLGCVTYGGEIFELSNDARRALQLISIFAAIRIQRLVGPRLPSPKLAPREIEVLKWCLHGKSDQDIGEILNISDRTIQKYVARACEKLNVYTRTQAVIAANEAGLLR
jgi:LuxR family quorum sensing-dependent transcriptional regulator